MNLQEQIGSFLEHNFRYKLGTEERKLWKIEYSRIGGIYATWGAIFAIFGAPTVLFMESNYEIDDVETWLFYRLFPSVVIGIAFLLFKKLKFSHEVLFIVIGYSLFIDYAYWPNCGQQDLFLYGQMTMLIPAAIVTLLRPFFFVINIVVQFALIFLLYTHYCQGSAAELLGSKEFIPVLIASVSSYLVATFRYFLIKRNFVFNLLLKKALDDAEEGRQKSDELLKNILPAEVAEELKETGTSEAKSFDQVSILFTDFKRFTEISERMSATELVSEIGECFKAFDRICEKYKIEKIKTIGDAYMACGGLPIPFEDSAHNTILAAQEMTNFITERKTERDKKGQVAFEMRCGIHTGPVVAGIVGVTKFQYDIWGDSVNTASRMESQGIVGQINISKTTYNLLKSKPGLNFEKRELTEVKGKGHMQMYFVNCISLDSSEKTTSIEQPLNHP